MNTNHDYRSATGPCTISPYKTFRRHSTDMNLQPDYFVAGERCGRISQLHRCERLVQSIHQLQAFCFAAMKATILLIDHNCSVSDSFSSTLRMEEYEVTLASNGQEALKALREKGFDLVLVDLESLGVSGWDTLGHIITIRLSLPVIFVAERPDQEWLTTQKGVAAVLKKPLDLKLLREVMARAIPDASGTRGRRSETGDASSDGSSDRRPGTLAKASL
jgi:CheY-like chemotaxis protein